MNRLIWGFMMLAAALISTGCVPRSQARAEAEKAFRAGEQAAMHRIQHARGPNVTVIGEVHDPFVPWTTGLTLAKAIVMAGYYGTSDPKEIVIIRETLEMRIEPERLLKGEEIPVLQGDVVRLIR